jgi:3-phenylpropionate/trans-cinnamate dioxygenase ferredoxin reductase component
VQTIAIVGGSLAGLKAAETLREDGFEGRIAVVGDEPPYDRPPLSKEILAGEMTPEQAALAPADGVDVEWLTGRRATALDVAARRVRLDGGDALGYDGLVIATGSAPRRLPGLEPDGDRVLELRTMADALRLRAILETASRVAVVGCGFIGVEVASAARARDVEVVLVSLDPPLAQAGALAGGVAEALLREHGAELRVGRTVGAVERGAGRCRVTLDDGEALLTDAVVVAVGAAPRTDWLAGSGLDVADGVLCDSALRVVGADAVVAAGDVARWPNPLFPEAPIRVEHWNNAIEQGAAAARALLAGEDAEPFAAVPSFWSDHFGVRLRSVGLPGLADRFEVTAGAVEERRFAAAAYRHGRLLGGVTYGIPRALQRIRSQLSTPATATTEA